ncbi:MAG: zf-TFIIB domain-containing protein [Thalassospira sp.]|nr:zf-TFIIB domain-containing protein [Thalassospira sp.]
MPLLVSPIDGSPMQQIVRNGIEIDRCATSGGVWLDKGELEKLLAAVHEAATQDREEYAQFRQAQPQRPVQQPMQQHPQHGYHPGFKPYKYDDDYDDYYKHKYGKSSKLKTIMDIFD